MNIQVPYEVGAGPAVLGINNNSQIAGFRLQIAPTSPGILSDGAGNVLPNSIARQGANATIFLTGAGDVPTLRTAFAPSLSTPPASQPRPLQPVSVTVGGVQAFVQSGGLAPGFDRYRASELHCAAVATGRGAIRSGDGRRRIESARKF